MTDIEELNADLLNEEVEFNCLVAGSLMILI